MCITLALGLGLMQPSSTVLSSCHNWSNDFSFCSNMASCFCSSCCTIIWQSMQMSYHLSRRWECISISLSKLACRKKVKNWIEESGMMQQSRHFGSNNCSDSNKSFFLIVEVNWNAGKFWKKKKKKQDTRPTKICWTAWPVR